MKLVIKVQINDYIEEKLLDDQRDLKWLANKVGTNYNTFYKRFNRDDLTAYELVEAARILNLSLDDIEKELKKPVSAIEIRREAKDLNVEYSKEFNGKTYNFDIQDGQEGTDDDYGDRYVEIFVNEKLYDRIQDAYNINSGNILNAYKAVAEIINGYLLEQE